MCGIAGFVGWRFRDDEAARVLHRMCGAISHRGPDDEGTHVDAGIGLGMRRLSVIDVSGGRQPVGNEDGTVRVVFNGEIYNHHALRDGLRRTGHRFASQSDTEVLVHLYEEDGDDLVNRLRGMFAFALWDAPRRRLVVARDRVGIKPLYYWPTEQGVVFASELRCLLAFPPFQPAVDHDAVRDYLALGYVPDPASILSGVRKLPPGHRLTWSAERGVEVAPYWSPIVPERPVTDEREAAEELRRLLDDAVSSHLEADVPLGAFLSGGLDSSTVVALMSRMMDRPVRTFSIGFDHPAYNEAPHAAAVAHALHTDHTELILRPDVDVLVEDVLGAFDEPFGDSSALPTFLVSGLARRHVTVALSGDGGDELFAGYTRYGEVAGARILPATLRAMLGALARRTPHLLPGRNRLLRLARDARGRYASTVSLPLDPVEGGIARPGPFASAHRADSPLDHLFDDVSERDLLAQLTLVDVASYLPGDILTKVDRASMAFSLEARVPLLDHPLVEFALGLPSRLKRRGEQGKWLLRRVAETLLPPEVLARPKQGFGVPLGHWFRRELSHRVDAMLRPSSPAHEFVDAAALRRIAWEHRIGRRDHSLVLWRVLALNSWLARFAGGALARPATPGASFETIVQRARSATMPRATARRSDATCPATVPAPMADDLRSTRTIP